MTAEEFWMDKTGNTPNQEELTAIIEFAKLHVEAQKQAVKKDLEEGLNETYGIYLTDDFKLEQTGNDLIDSAYPLTNIK
jgi:hypothetical protein